MDTNKFVATYEFKSPSYELRSPRIDASTLAHPAPKFAGGGSCWRSIDGGVKDRITILVVGDLLCQEGMIGAYRKADGSGYDFSPCFRYVAPILKSADLVIGNLETPVSETAPYRGEILTHEGPFYCNAPVEYLAAVRNAGFDVATTANNHILDAGLRGLAETELNCDKLGLVHTGCSVTKARSLVIDVHGFKIGLAALASSYNDMQWNLRRKGQLKFLNTYSEKRAHALKRMLDEQGAEYTICFPHWGQEYTDAISNKQQRAADALASLGYDAILGSHSHTVQKFNRIAGVPVVFSLGNFISHLGTAGKADIEYTVICKIKLSRQAGSVVSTFSFIPCCILKGLPGTPLTVLPCGSYTDLPENTARKLEVADTRVRERLEADKWGLDIEHPALSNLPVPDEDAPVYSAATAPKATDAARAFYNQQAAHLLQTSGEGFHYAQQAKTVLKVFSDHAELVLANPNLTVLNCPKEVEGVPVTAMRLSNAADSRARVVYLGTNALAIPNEAFKGCKTLEAPRLFNGLKTLGDEAFAGCTSLRGVALPESVERIGKRCFAGCHNLMSVKIPPNVTQIAPDAFEGCEKLIVYCERGSAAERYAKEKGLTCVHMPLSKASRAKQAWKHRAKWARKLQRKLQVWRARMRRKSGMKKRELAPDTPEVRYGPMNGPKDSHPVTVLAACEALGAPLPEGQRCKFAPSHYLGANRFSGSAAEIESLLKGRMPDLPEGELERSLQLFKGKYLSQGNLEHTDTDLTVYFCDWLLFARERGFTHNCYFDYELYNKEPDVRDTFLNEGYRKRVHRACATRGARQILRDKAQFNRFFSAHVNRDWVDASTCSFEEFVAFLDRHEKFFAKPVRGTGGAGAHVVRSDVSAPADLYASCKNNEMICEEIVRQHPDIAAVNADTLNTVRITTLLDADGVAHIVLAVARFGRAGKAVDNFHGGGVGATVDIDTGQIVSEAINRAHLRSPFHPDSGMQILGLQYPEWEQVKKAVCESAKLLPEMRNIGWDVAVTAEGEIEFIEGNGFPNYDVLQSPDQVGRRFRYEPYLSAIEKMHGIEHEELPPLVVTLEHDPRKLSVEHKARLAAKKAKRLARRVLRRV